MTHPRDPWVWQAQEYQILFSPRHLMFEANTTWKYLWQQGIVSTKAERICLTSIIEGMVNIKIGAKWKQTSCRSAWPRGRERDLNLRTYSLSEAGQWSCHHKYRLIFKWQWPRQWRMKKLNHKNYYVSNIFLTSSMWDHQRHYKS